MRDLKIPTILNGHVIVDVRDGSQYESHEHSDFEALTKFCQDQHLHGRIDDDLASRCHADLVQMMLKSKMGGLGAIIRIGSSAPMNDEEFFSDEELEKYNISTAGPFYTLMGCCHSKNAIEVLRWVDSHLSEIDEKVRELTDEELAVASAARHFVAVVTKPDQKCRLD